MKTSITAGVVGGALTLGVGIHTGLPGSDDAAANSAPAVSTRGTTVEPRAELDCRDTANKYEEEKKIFLYKRSSCVAANDAWDDGNDSDYGDGKGRVKKFNNRADSIVNTTKHNVAFYNRPGYQGKNFCVRPGEYVHRLYVYGDGAGTNDWWSNSISSHRFVAAKKCDRWFGWRVE